MTRNYRHERILFHRKSLRKHLNSSFTYSKSAQNSSRLYLKKITLNLDVPEVLTVRMNEIYKKLTTIK